MKLFVCFLLLSGTAFSYTVSGNTSPQTALDRTCRPPERASNVEHGLPTISPVWKIVHHWGVIELDDIDTDIS